MCRHANTPKLGRPRLAGSFLRVTLSSTTVAPATKAQLKAWADQQDCSPGMILDALVTFAVIRGFMGLINESGGSPTTDHPAALSIPRKTTIPTLRSVNRKPSQPATRHAKK